MSPSRLSKAINALWARISAKIDAATLETSKITVFRPARWL